MVFEMQLTFKIVVQRKNLKEKKPFEFMGISYVVAASYPCALLYVSFSV